MKYTPPLHSSAPDAGYTDPVDGTIPAAAVEHPMREIANVIHAAGLVSSETDLTQLDQAIDLKVAAMQPDLAEFVGTDRNIVTTEPLLGGGSLATDLSLGINAAAAPTPRHVILRDAAGRARVADPVADGDIATKHYTDHAVQGSGRARRSSDLTLYIRTDGNDAHDGLENTPQRALASFEGARRVLRTLDMQGHTLSVKFSPGTYGTAVELHPGDFSCAAAVGIGSADPEEPARISTATAAVHAVRFPGVLFLSDICLRTTSTGAACIRATGSHVHLGGTICCEPADGSAVYGERGARYSMLSGCAITFAGNCRCGLDIQSGSDFFSESGTSFSCNNPVFTDAGLYARVNSCIQLHSATTMSGAATGRRYVASICSIIQTHGKGADFIPGTQSGEVHNGSFYY